MSSLPEGWEEDIGKGRKCIFGRHFVRRVGEKKGVVEQLKVSVCEGTWL